MDAGNSQFDLHLIVEDRYDTTGAGVGLSGVMTFATALFEEQTVRRFADRLVRLLAAVVSEPSVAVGDYALSDENEIELVTRNWNDTAVDFGVPATTTLVSLFDERVALANGSSALVWDEGSLSYAEFDARANRLARWLVSAGVGPEALVGLAMRRSVELIVGMFAVAKAGGAYVPMDPDGPPERTAAVLATARPALVLSTTRDGFAPPQDSAVVAVEVDGLDLSSFAQTPLTDAERRAPLRAANTAYVIFTSGSTGRPKGVAVPHAAVVNQMLWVRSEFALAEQDAALLKTAATFDLSVWEFWSILLTGGRLVIANPDGQLDPAYLLRVLRATEVTTLHSVPSMLSMLATTAGGELAPSLRRVLAIGEALPATTAQRFRDANPDVELFNLYGPTEAAVSVTSHAVSAADETSVSIGGPEANSRAYVLDERMHPVSPGVVGELYLAGVQLARGYHARPDLTAERFVADPFDPAGGRLYRTGDLVRWTASGELDYVGRTDFQVKLRGFRVELGEIEAALRRSPQVSDAVVLAYSDPRVGDRLVGYVVPENGFEFASEALSSWAQGELPGYMVPTAWVVLDAMPLNPNGKLDRAALPAPSIEVSEFRAPTSPVEEIVAAVYADLLGVERVGVDDDFFALGGNSLVATQLVARVGAALDADVPVRVVFEAPTVGRLATRVTDLVGSGARPALVPMPRPNRIPLSLAQQGMWVLNRFDPESGAYNIPAAIRLAGTLDLAALSDAMGDVIARHEVLRTRYPEDTDGPFQDVLPIDDTAVDYTHAVVSSAELPTVIRDTVTAGFDVTLRPPIRIRLFEIDPAEHVLVVVVHHIACDGFSMAPLTRDVMSAYQARLAGAPPQWLPLPVQYADYAIWQRDVLGERDDAESVLARQLAYWQTSLAGLPALLELPTDRPRPPVASEFGAEHQFTIEDESAARLQEFARERGSTVFMVLHAALAVLLSRLSGSNDIGIGTPVAGRGERVLDDLVGMFVNTVVLRVQTDPALKFAELLDRVREQDLAAFGHADVPFEQVVDAVAARRSKAFAPLVQVLLAFQNVGTQVLSFPDLEVSAMDSPFERAKFDLQLSAAETFDEHGRIERLDLVFTYATDLFDHDTIVLFAERLTRIVAAVGADPEIALREIDIRVESERTGPTPRPTVADLPELVAAAARMDPDAIAFAHEGADVTFETLDQRLTATQAAMGSAVPVDAVVTVVVSGLVPGGLAALGGDGYATMLDSLLTEAVAVAQRKAN